MTLLTLDEYLETLPGRADPAERRRRLSAARNVQRLLTLLVSGGHTPPGARLVLGAEGWPTIALALGAMNEQEWSMVGRVGNTAVRGLPEALAATIQPPPTILVVVEAPADVTPSQPGTPPAPE